jgi:amino acid transporter
MASAAIEGSIGESDAPASLQRGISWTGAFWIASGVPALVLFTVGTIAATVGTASWLVWTLSISFGFIQAFSYAEIAGLFPNKSGGASIYGAVAWARYSKLFAPVSVWCNWLAWSPVLSIGSGLAAGYTLSILFGADAAINAWHITLLDLSGFKAGLSLRINAAALIGAGFLLIAFAIQHRGISSTARVQVILGVVALLPLMIIGLVPFLTGDVALHNLAPIVPLTHDAAGKVVPGSWNGAGITLFLGGMFVAAWSTYGFETAVC